MAAKSEYQLSAAESDVLSAATKEAMGVVGRAGAPGGGAGARFGARFLKPNTAEATVETRHAPEVCRTRAAEAIREAGTLIENPNAVEDGTLWGLVLSGAMNMMPALVRVEVTEWLGGGSSVVVRATGNEGLIKQKIGANAADRVAGAVARP